jgi:uncharacterized protein
MSKRHFFLKLIGPRPTFPADITEDERRLMQEHALYTRTGFDARKILVYGPVMAPTGAFGMAVFEVSDEAEIREFMSSDPSVRAGLMTFEVYPMRVGAAQAFGPED